MTDETKGDGMTLEQVLDGLRRMKTYPDSMFSKWADAIDAHLAAQSAMRVDEAFERGWRTACDWAKRPDMIYDIGSPAYERDKRAALQAAVGGKE